MKTCTECRETKSLSEFHQDRRAKDGLRCSCKVCHRADQRTRYEANRTKVLARQTDYYGANKETVKAKVKAYKEAHPEKVKSQNKAWREANPDKVNTKNAQRRARKLRACPSWARKCPKIAKIYEIAGNLRKHGFDVHVDHIIPLKPTEPDAPRGLHVAWNLQILPATVNLRKHNTVEYASL